MGILPTGFQTGSPSSLACFSLIVLLGADHHPEQHPQRRLQARGSDQLRAGGPVVLPGAAPHEGLQVIQTRPATLDLKSYLPYTRPSQPRLQSSILLSLEDLHEDPLSLPKKLWHGMREKKLARAFSSLPLGHWACVRGPRIGSSFLLKVWGCC